MPSQCDFSANLRAARARASLNQGQLAKAIHTAQTNLSKWERGVSSPTVDNLLLLAKALGTTAAELLAGCVLQDTTPDAKPPAKATMRSRTASPRTRLEEAPPILRRPRRQAPASGI